MEHNFRNFTLPIAIIVLLFSAAVADVVKSGSGGTFNLNEIGHTMGNAENAIVFVDNLKDAWTLVE